MDMFSLTVFAFESSSLLLPTLLLVMSCMFVRLGSLRVMEVTVMIFQPGPIPVHFRKYKANEKKINKA
jgi:hypothetical protein